MAELAFFYGTMNCGKSTLALQMHHNAARAGKTVLLFSKHDRGGAVISSRIGLEQPALTVTDDVDLFAIVQDHIRSGVPVDELICDEAPFYGTAQIEQLALVVDELDIDVKAFGLLTDFTTHLFPGGKRLLELADRRIELQVEALCWCGARGTHNARTVNGQIVRDGASIVVGDVAVAGDAAGEVAYEVLCRRHHREGITRVMADRQPGRSDVDVVEVTARPG